ncbi:MAG: alpha/beta fold hydrolase [Acidobacteriota bacterium]|nr:alpha/beta fold hydrolase [Acidobacteriota bacterium]
MKKLLLLSLAWLFAVTTAIGRQPSIEGYWEGAAVRDGAVRVIRLDIFRDGANLRCRVEMPDFLNFAFPPLPVQLNGDKVTLRLPMTGEYLLTHDAKLGEMRGAFSGQQALPVTIHFKRGVKPAELSVREEVRFPNGDITLAGTLIKPMTAGPHPVIVWLSGRGSSNRQDSPTLRVLAEHGIASLIYDKRGSGQSTGNFAKATFNELVGDALAAVRFLAQRKDINAKQIGLSSQSAGGWVAPVVVTQSEVPIAFVITTVGPAESLYNQQAHAYQYWVRTGGFELTKEETELMNDHIPKRLRFAFKNEGREEFMASAAKVKGTRLERFLLDTEAADAADFDWLRRNDCDPVPHLKKIKTPWLAFYGTRDYIVPPTENTRKLEQYLTEAGNQDFKIVVFDDADHSLMLPNMNRRESADANAKTQFTWGRTPLELTQTMLDWLLARVIVAQKR